MKAVSRQFGELEFDEEHVVEFREGPVGFEDYRRFVIVADKDSEPFRWLISIESPELSFPLLDPSLLLPEYAAAKIPSQEREVWVIAALHDDVKKSSVNLRSPIVIDVRTRAAEQVILDDDTLPFQFPLVPPTNSGGE